MDERDLTQKQRKWLEASRRIGPGAMTKTEKQILEKLYADMLPREQQDLAEYIRARFGKKESMAEEGQDPIEQMSGKLWKQPSSALRSVFAKLQTLKRPKDGA
ncbi:MAG: hypothetical protein WCG29_07615 [Desulfomonile sp.]|nr:hypothetical protein [Deltaproteobacteria bacterium]